MKIARTALLFVLLLSVLASSFALEKKYFVGQFYMFERTERFESIYGGAVTYLKPTGNDEFEIPGDAILLEGVISDELVKHIRRLMTQYSLHNIYLDSPGGDLLAGVELGQFLHEGQSVAVVHIGAQCKSACALAFLGAEMRLVLGNSHSLGFHRQYRLVDGKATYGSQSADQRLIARYLQSVQATGITAEEVVTTTGQITFSDASLAERGLVTITKEELRDSSKRLVAMSGMTYFEVVSAICARYDRARTEGASIETLSKVVACLGRKPAIREPLLRLAMSPWPFTSNQELDIVTGAGVIEALRSEDPAIVAAFNLAGDDGRGNYQRYLDRRKALRDKREKK